MKEEKIISVATYSYSRAHLLKGRLESEGIECFLKNENLIQPDISTGVNVLIRESDVAGAMKIIEEIKKEYGEERKPVTLKERKERKILLPVDFSKDYPKTTEVAIALAAKLHAQIKLLHVYYEPIISPVPYEDTVFPIQTNPTAFMTDTGRDHKKEMVELKNELNEQLKKEGISGVEITYSMINGLPSEAILMYSDTYKPDIIILGTKGKESEDSLWGSTTKEIIANTKYPVLAVPEKFVFKPIESIQNILYATDFDDSDFVSVSHLLNLVRFFDVKVHCVHVSLGRKKPWDKAKFDEMNEYMQKEFGEIRITCDLIVSDDIFKGLEAYIRNNDIGLISMTTHKRNMITKLLNPSLTQRMMFHTRLPLLVYPS